MKRSLAVLLLLILLSGCGNNQNAAQTEESTTQTTKPVVITTYLSGSEVEQKTDGAVRQYQIEGKRIDWIAPMNGGVLAASAGQQTVLWTLSGEEGQITATATVPARLSDKSLWQTTDSGFIYYLAEAKQIVILDAALKETAILELPDEISGDPAIAQDGSEIFYCIDQTVYAMDTDLKIARPVRTNTCEEQMVIGCYMNGAVIACSVRDAQKNWNTLYISSEDGQLLHRDNGMRQMYSHDDSYFALWADGTTNRYIYGTLDTTPMQLNIPDQEAFGVPELNGVVGKTESADGVMLNFYNLQKTATVTLPAAQSPKAVAADSADRAVWLLTADGTLLRWSPEASAIEEGIDYTGPVYTAAEPDLDGLIQCTKRAEAIAEKNGVIIRIYDRALMSNDDYDVEVEYQTYAINRTLDALETQLEKFPSKFLAKSVSGEIRICIVRSIRGEQTSAYHWYDGDPFIILSAGMDVEKAFMDAFAYVLDIHVLGNSSLADDWESLNPEGFTYGGETTVMAYLEGESRAFADRRAMQSATDDRTSVFYHAVLADNAAVFQSETMQAKLKMLCQAIRDAWDLEKSAETFLWEQYLT